MQRKVVAGSNKATNPPPLPLHLCGHCKQPAQTGKSLLVCSSCHEGWYCSPEHQVADWPCHKALCKQRKKEKKEKEEEKERKESDAAINYLLLNPPVAARPPTAELFESLCVACCEGEVGRARQILLSGVDVNWQSQGFKPAYVACQNGRTECLSLLINHGAQLDKAHNTGTTPAIIACENGHTECLSLLINHGTQLDKANNGGFTPAYIVCQNGRTECLSLLINHGTQLDKATNESATPAYIACQFGHTECLSLLINHGTQLDKADNEGVSPAYIACQNGHTECLSLLVNHGVDCSKTRDDGSGPIHMACENGHFECVNGLLDRGKVDVNCADINRQTPAYKCCVAGHVKILHLLADLAHGADLSLADTSG
jgi:ankyrin repeat protein